MEYVKSALWALGFMIFFPLAFLLITRGLAEIMFQIDKLFDELFDKENRND
jgi:hypothetical protein